MAQEESKEGLTTLFRVVIPGLKEMVFTSCEGIEAEIEVRYFPSGGDLSAPRAGRGMQRSSKITFGHGSATAGGGKSVFDWFAEVSDSSKALTKKTIAVVVQTTEGEDLAEWRIQNAWPCRWTAPLISKDNTSLTVDLVSFAHEGIERKK